MNQRNVFLVIVVIIVTLVFALFASYLDNLQVPKKTVEAKITDFTVDCGGLPAIVGVTVVISFNVTIKNTGTENISKMNVKLDIILNGTNYLIEDNNLYSNEENFTVNSGETTIKKISFFVDFITQQRMAASHQNFLAIIVSNSTVLDERELF